MLNWRKELLNEITFFHSVEVHMVCSGHWTLDNQNWLNPIWRIINECVTDKKYVPYIFRSPKPNEPFCIFHKNNCHPLICDCHWCGRRVAYITYIFGSIFLPSNHSENCLLRYALLFRRMISIFHIYIFVSFRFKEVYQVCDLILRRKYWH